jgi:hypothetical protein
MPKLEPKHLCSSAALIAAGNTAMCKQKGEYDTEFVKRIVCAYINAIPKVEEMDRMISRYFKEHS